LAPVNVISLESPEVLVNVSAFTKVVDDTVPVIAVGTTLNCPQLDPVVQPVFFAEIELIPEDAVTKPENLAVAPVRIPLISSVD
jgi:hypothetical protein